MIAAASILVRVACKREEASQIASLELVAADGAELPRFTPGSHVDVALPNGLTRPYSLCNAPTERHRYLIAVLREPESRGGSAAIHDLVNEGSELRISVPRNQFALAPHARRHLLLAGGIGITPLLSMAEQLAHDGADFALHYATRSPDRTAFREQLLRSRFAERVTFYFDDRDASQRLNLPALLTAPQPETHLYVCGPRGFMESVIEVATRAGWNAALIHQESFGGGTKPLPAGGRFEVELASSGRIVEVPAHLTVLQALTNAGVAIPSSCEQGTCGTCLTRVVEGVPDHRDEYLSPEERASNDQFLPCCSRASSARLVLEL